MKTLWTALFLLTLQFFAAQENEVYADGIFGFEENKTQKIFTDWTRVRKEPMANSPILDSLPTNLQIMILKKDETVPVLQLGKEKQTGIKSPTRKGMQPPKAVWGGNLCVGYRNKNGYDFLLDFQKQLVRKAKTLMVLKNKILPE